MSKNLSRHGCQPTRATTITQGENAVCYIYIACAFCFSPRFHPTFAPNFYDEFARSYLKCINHEPTGYMFLLDSLYLGNYGDGSQFKDAGVQSQSDWWGLATCNNKASMGHKLQKYNQTTTCLSWASTTTKLKGSSKNLPPSPPPHTHIYVCG